MASKASLETMTTDSGEGIKMGQDLIEEEFCAKVIYVKPYILKNRVGSVVIRQTKGHYEGLTEIKDGFKGMIKELLGQISQIDHLIVACEANGTSTAIVMVQKPKMDGQREVALEIIRKGVLLRSKKAGKET